MLKIFLLRRDSLIFYFYLHFFGTLLLFLRSRPVFPSFLYVFLYEISQKDRQLIIPLYYQVIFLLNAS
jgi:hypothetical protein